MKTYQKDLKNTPTPTREKYQSWEDYKNSIENRYKNKEPAGYKIDVCVFN